MVWAPTRAIITPRAIPDNLLTYATDATRQAAALGWAGDGSLKLIKQFSRSIANRVTPVYPTIAFAQDDDAADHSEDIITAAYSATFEISIQNSDPDQAVADARIYDGALRSMFVNCPNATLLDDTGATTASLQSIETAFKEILSNETHTDFLQQFQIRVVYAIWLQEHV